MMLLHVHFIALMLLGFALADDIILKPVKEGKQEVALVFIQGSQIKPDQYVPLVSKLQNVSEFSLWVGIPEYTADLLVPIDLSGGIKRVLGEMQLKNTTRVFFAGHSLGGALLQGYTYEHDQEAPGQILLGSYLQRKYRNVTYPIPTLTVSGELDGLCRVTRIMEAVYHQVIHGKSPNTSFPVVVVEGMNHFQVASGEPPFLVMDRDLKPEISEDVAHSTVATLMAAFIATRMGNLSRFDVISAAMQKTKTFVQPLIKGYEMEGFYNFKPPCYGKPAGPNCTFGCPWSQMSQPIMGGLKNAKLVVTDAFHPVYQINPVHLPHIYNNCTGGDIPSCKLNVTTVTQAVYQEVDKLDTGFVPTSAQELRVKMKSRQAVMEATGMGNVDFNKTDGGSLCKVINQASYDWGMNNIGSSTLTRFKKYGEPMIMGEDKGPYNAGPLWIWNPLEYISKNVSGNLEIEVRSIMMRTPTDYFIKASAGFHYCKLLSPARVMEWTYVDGLRAHFSLNNKTMV